jgi:diacylglycerol kinase (ATP)
VNSKDLSWDSPRRVIILVNPISGKGRGRSIAAQMTELGASYYGLNFVLGGSTLADIFDTLHSLESEKEPCFVVVVGGDGLVHHALQALVGTSHCLCVYPAGTGNDISRTLKTYGYRVEEFLELLDNGVPTSIDVAKVTLPYSTRYFLQVLTIGFDSKVNARANGFKRIKGAIKYTCATIVELLHLRPDRMRIALSDSIIERDLLMIDIGNGSTYGGGMKILPSADPTDGLLNVMTVSPVNRFELLRVFPKVFTGKHLSHKAVSHYTCETLSIEGNSLVYADGEAVGMLPVDIDILPGQLNVLMGVRG